MTDEILDVLAVVDERINCYTRKQQNESHPEDTRYALQHTIEALNMVRNSVVSLIDHEATKAATPDDVAVTPEDEVRVLTKKLAEQSKVADNWRKFGQEMRHVAKTASSKVWKLEQDLNAALRNTQGVPREVVDALEIANKCRLYNGQYMPEVFPEIGKALAILDQHARGGDG